MKISVPFLKKLNIYLEYCALTFLVTV